MSEDRKRREMAVYSVYLEVDPFDDNSMTIMEALDAVDGLDVKTVKRLDVEGIENLDRLAEEGDDV